MTKTAIIITIINAMSNNVFHATGISKTWRTCHTLIFNILENIIIGGSIGDYTSM